MKEDRITQFKWFWGWQDDKQEAWLEEMSQKGLHLVDIKAFGRYLFEIDADKSYIYRMDFDRSSGKTSDYFRLIEDAGWERVITVQGWQYWRKERSGGKTPEIFTDNASKIKKYERFLTSMLVSTPASMFIILLAQFKRFPGRHPQWVIIVTISLYAAWFLFLGVNIVKVIQRINQLKRRQTL
jgi:hypothetical protein